MKVSKALAILAALTATTAQAGIFNHIFKYRGYKFDSESKTCVNKKGKRGFSKNYYGQCGDLTGFNAKKLVKKINRKHVAKNSLIGSKLMGLDLSGAKIETVNMAYTDLRGTNLSKVRLNSLKDHLYIKGAKYDETTLLPFSDYTAISIHQMVKLDYKSITTVYPNPMDIFEETNHSAVSEKLKTIASITKRYHNELLGLVEEVDSLSYDQLRMILESTYVTAVEYRELAKQRDIATGSELARVNDLLNAYSDLGVIVNKIINTALPKLEVEDNMDQIVDLVLDYFPTKYHSQLHNGFSFISEKFEAQLSDGAYLKVIQILDHTTYGNTTESLKNAVSDYMKREEKVVFAEIANVLGFIERNNELVFNILFSKFNSFTTSEYLSLMNNYRFFKSYFENRTKISDLTFSNSIELSRAFSYSRKDVILFEAIQKRSFVTVKELDSVIREHAYRLFDIAEASFDLITENSESLSHELAAANKSNFSDLILAHYYVTMKKSITIADYYALKTNLKSLSNFISNTAKIGVDFTIFDIIEIAGKINADAKKAIVKRFFELVGTITTDEILLLYEKTVFDLKDLTSNLAKVSDLDIKNTVKMARHFKNNTSDAIIDYFINKYVKTTGISVRDLILLADVSYNGKKSILNDNLKFVNNWSVINASVLMSNSPSEIKNSIGEYYLTNIVTKASLSYPEISKIIESGYNYYGGADELLLKHLDKISGFNFEMMQKVASKYSRSSRDIVLKYYLENEAKLTTVNLRDAASLSYNNKYEFIKEYIGKTVDQSAANTKLLADNLYRSQKDVIVKVYLDSVSSISATDLVTVATSTYGERDALIIANVSKVSNLSVANAISINTNLYKYSKDQFLLKAISYLTDLSVNNIYEYASSAYSSSAKDQILKTGLEVLGQE